MNYLYSAYFATWAIHFAYLGIIALKLLRSGRLEREIVAAASPTRAGSQFSVSPDSPG